MDWHFVIFTGESERRLCFLPFPKDGRPVYLAIQWWWGAHREEPSEMTKHDRADLFRL